MELLQPTLVELFSLKFYEGSFQHKSIESEEASLNEKQTYWTPYKKSSVVIFHRSDRENEFRG